MGERGAWASAGTRGAFPLSSSDDKEEEEKEEAGEMVWARHVAEGTGGGVGGCSRGAGQCKKSTGSERG